MSRTRVLYISNNHPEFYIGGVEVYSFELFQAMRESDEIEPILLVRSVASAHRFHQGTPFHSVNDDPNQILWDQSGHDCFFMTSPDKANYICSNIGGMAEKVAHGINGLHFRVGDPVDLAATLRRAAGSPELWSRLRAGIPAVYPIEEAVVEHRSLYRSLLDNSKSGNGRR